MLSRGADRAPAGVGRRAVRVTAAAMTSVLRIAERVRVGMRGRYSGQLP